MLVEPALAGSARFLLALVELAVGLHDLLRASELLRRQPLEQVEDLPRSAVGARDLDEILLPARVMSALQVTLNIGRGRPSESSRHDDVPPSPLHQQVVYRGARC